MVLVGRQRLTAHLIDFQPKPDQRYDQLDFFLNAVTSVTHTAPHQEMTIRMTCRVDVMQDKSFEDVSPSLATLPDLVGDIRDLSPTSPVHFLGPSPRLRPNADVTGFALQHSSIADTVAQNVVRLGKALHDFMTFDSTATTVDTDPTEAFQKQRGVCQDMSHIMILALRALGIPAAYVSGYLRTLPPEGGIRLEGVDAMHAWVRAWCGPQLGWIEFDPTNATLVGTDHIVVGYGRDYSDVSPVVGNLRSAGAQVNSQSVDVASVG